MICGVGHRRGSDPALLWLWRRPAATAWIRLLILGTSICLGSGPRRGKKTKKKKKKDFCCHRFDPGPGNFHRHAPPAPKQTNKQTNKKKWLAGKSQVKSLILRHVRNLCFRMPKNQHVVKLKPSHQTRPSKTIESYRFYLGNRNKYILWAKMWSNRKDLYWQRKEYWPSKLSFLTVFLFFPTLMKVSFYHRGTSRNCLTKLL